MIELIKYRLLKKLNSLKVHSKIKFRKLLCKIGLHEYTPTLNYIYFIEVVYNDRCIYCGKEVTRVERV